MVDTEPAYFMAVGRVARVLAQGLVCGLYYLSVCPDEGGLVFLEREPKLVFKLDHQSGCTLLKSSYAVLAVNPRDG